jgi:hypothetical protein
MLELHTAGVWITCVARRPHKLLLPTPSPVLSLSLLFSTTRHTMSQQESIGHKRRNDEEVISRPVM